MNKVKLFFIPHAGGSSRSYLSFKRYLDQSIVPCILEPTGRGSRVDVPFYQSMEEAAEDLLKELEKQIEPGEAYAIFGHSVGTLYTYALIQIIKARGLKEPVHVFFSGRCAPWLPINGPRVADLEDEAFINVFLNYGGIPEEIVNNQELLKFYLPILRADTAIAEKKIFYKTDLKCECDVSIFSGENDPLLPSKEQMLEWKAVTNASCNFYEFKEGHFYFNKCKEDVCKVISEVLTSIIK